MKCTACSKTFPMLYASSEGGLCYTCMQNHLAATAASPGPTTTPVEKRVEDVATDVWSYRRGMDCFDIYEGETHICETISEHQAKRLCDRLNTEPQPISNPLVTYEEALDAWMEDVGKMLDVKSRAMALAGFQDGWKAARKEKL